MSDRDLYFDPIIPRNTTIPTTIEKTYTTSHDDQYKVEIKVYQGEYSDPDLNNYLGKFSLAGIPPAPAGEEKITIAFSYDVNGILQVDAKIISTGEKAAITISTSDSSMVEEIDISKWKESKKARKYTSIIRRAEKVVLQEGDDTDELQDLIRMLKEALIKEESTEILEECKDDIIDYLLDLENDDE